MKPSLISVSPDGLDLALHESIVKLLSLENSAIKEHLKELDPKDLKSPCAVRLFREAGKEALMWIGSHGRASSEAAVIGYADAILLEGDEPPRAISIFPQAMQICLASEKIRYETDGAGLIVGAVDFARPVAAGLARLGLKRLLVVDPDDHATEKLVATLSRRLVGIQIEALSRSRLTQIPTEASIAVNLVEAFDDSILEESILEDVSYMNFLKPEGVWIDWTGATVERGFSDEIANAGVMAVNSLLIRRQRDALLISKLTGRKAEDVYRSLADGPVSHSG
jgi:hypothetical protein